MSPQYPPRDEKEKKEKNLWHSLVLPGGMEASSRRCNWVSGLEKQADSDKASLLRRA